MPSTSSRNGLRKIRRISILFRCTETGQRPNVCVHMPCCTTAPIAGQTQLFDDGYIWAGDVVKFFFVFFFLFIFYYIHASALALFWTAVWRYTTLKGERKRIAGPAGSFFSSPTAIDRTRTKPKSGNLANGVRLFPLVLPLTFKMIIDALAYEWAWRLTRFGRIWTFDLTSGTTFMIPNSLNRHLNY